MGKIREKMIKSAKNRIKNAISIEFFIFHDKIIGIK